MSYFEANEFAKSRAPIVRLKAAAASFSKSAGVVGDEHPYDAICKICDYIKAPRPSKNEKFADTEVWLKPLLKQWVAKNGH